ncbi:MAG TPA: beta-ketoacyl synthase N-terminal-like domain-containing protein, partial [Ktedonobacteraceae bacterium]|nr:beta-ketoacyl synthase N-terminal-like domain-containing protein [Ktedonobacteraceae bacterium]
MGFAREDAAADWRPTFAEAQSWLTTKIAGELGLEAGAIDPRESFAAFGLESVDLVGISGELEEWLGRELSPTLLYEYPTIESMARFLSGEQEEQAAPQAEAAKEHDHDREPLAIVGMACRFPGSSSPEDFWDFLLRGGDAIGPVPADRWDVEAYYDPDRGAPGKMYTRAGAFLATEEIRSFDAGFFGISPREARRMDPQQRLLLTVAWEALERAGYAVPELAGSQVGIFIGLMNTQDYASLQRASEPEASLDDPYFALGSASSVFAGRLAYLLDVHGPALTVDTACSSSLVALHLACQSLRRGECDLAVVGGVHAILWPETLVNACKMGMLSTDGRCKTFDASADGFGLGEGCGVVVLKRLATAQEDGNPVCALIHGSAVNQDGHSNGLTAPNPQAQQAVIRQALSAAGIAPAQIGYVEAHGSGTALGDPLEAQALLAVFGSGDRPQTPLLVGSVKTNVGHLAGAAGMAGLFKTVLALQHGLIPPHLHVTRRNEHLPASELLQIPAQPTNWPAHLTERYAGVSSFGWSGTNAHVILQAPPELPTCPAGASDERDYWLPLSARSEEALRRSEQRLLAWLHAHPNLSLADLAATLQTGRPAWEYRRLLRARSVEELQTLLAAPAPRMTHVPPRNGETRPVVFLIPGLGEQEQAWKLARELYEQEPAFASWFERCAEILQPLLNCDLRALLAAEASAQAALLQDIRLAHPFLFAVAYALALV